MSALPPKADIGAVDVLTLARVVRPRDAEF